jgi:serine/threonine protein kinase
VNFEKYYLYSFIGQVAVAVGGGGGTIAYRAPELLRGISVDKVSSVRFDKADVYSIGVTLWQLLSRRTPFTNIFDSSNAIMWNVVIFGARPDGTSTKQGLQEEQQIIHTPEMVIFSSRFALPLLLTMRQDILPMQSVTSCSLRQTYLHRFNSAFLLP